MPSSDAQKALAALLMMHMVKDVMDDSDEDAVHCAHCSGKDGDCKCKHGCPPQDTTRCSAVHHCEHCKGFEGGKCACKYGCAESMYSKCVVVHEGFSCVGCKDKEHIKGARFECSSCFHVNLCESCYNAGAEGHDPTHVYKRYDRVGSEPVIVEPRRQGSSRALCDGSALVDTPSSPTQSEQVKEAPKRPDPDSRFKNGDKVELMGLKSADMNGAIAIVEESDTTQVDGRVQIRLETQKPGLLCCVKEENLKKYVEKKDVEEEEEEKIFRKGQMVQFVGLKKADMNGKKGMIDCYVPDGRVLVCLVGGGVASVKPENLDLIADVLD